MEAGYFLQVRLSDGRIFDFAEPGIEFPGQHFAFLVDDATFDALIRRIRDRNIEHWADPQQRRPGEINHNHGGRGVSFLDPDGHYLEAITTATTAAASPDRWGGGCPAAPPSWARRFRGTAAAPNRRDGQANSAPSTRVIMLSKLV